MRTADYAVIPDILNAPDTIEDAGRSQRTRHRLVRWVKTIDGEK